MLRTSYWMEQEPGARESAGKLTSQLLLGSEVIDRQKAEVKRLVNGLIGLLRAAKIALPEIPACVRFVLGGFEWGVYGHRSDSLEIVAYLMDNGGQCVAFESRNPDSLAFRHVAEVHAALPILVHGMFETFPQLQALVEPIVAAAQNAQVVTPARQGTARR